MAGEVPARPGACWDGRFALGAGSTTPPGATLGALGQDASTLRRRSRWPAALLRTLPALRRDGILLAVPHLHYPDAVACRGIRLRFSPPSPASGAPFAPVAPAGVQIGPPVPIC